MKIINNIKPVFFTCFFLCSLSANAKEKALVPTTNTSISNNINVNDDKLSDKLELRDWFALGSGCRASSQKEGDVTISNITNVGINRFKISATLSKYILDGNVPVRAQNATFARECGIRLSLYPQKGFKLTNVEIQTELLESKDNAVKTEHWLRLIVGNATIATIQDGFEKAKKLIAHPIPIKILPVLESREVFDNISCESPKIVGFDISLRNYRDDFKPQVNIKLNGNVDFFVEYTKCTK